MPKYDKPTGIKKALFEKVINMPLLPEHEEQLVQLEADVAGLIEQMEILLDTGYSIQLDRDPNREQYACRLCGEWENCPNAGKWLYGNSDTLWGAVAVATFKHFFLADGGKWGDGQTSNKKRFS